VVLVRYSRFFRVKGDAACLTPAPGGWTTVSVKQPAQVTVEAELSLSGITRKSCQGAAG
jgi:hypothetical protein